MATNLPDLLTTKDKTSRDIKYLNKDFSSFRKSLLEYAKSYFPNTYQDFNTASPGSMFIEMAAYIGDVLSLYVDQSFRENLLNYAEQKENVVAIAQAMGWRVRNVAPSMVELTLYQICPADGSGELNPKHLLRLNSGCRFGTNSSLGSDRLVFRTNDFVDFSEPTRRQVQIYSVDSGTGLPLSYLVSKKITAISAEEKQFTYQVNDVTRYLKIEVPDDKVISVYSIVDSNGNTWYEVDNLAQDLIFQDTYVPAIDEDGHTPPAFTATSVKTDYRYTTRLNRELKTEILFGGGNNTLSDIVTEFDPKQIYDPEYAQQVTVTPITQFDLTLTNSFGLAPSNTTLTIKYLSGGGVDTNVPSNSITEVLSLNLANDISNYTTQETNTFNTAKNSLTVVNTVAATGGADEPSIDEIRQITLGFFSSQDRVVTNEDYNSRVLAMPAKYGAVAKVFVTADEQINKVIEWTVTGDNVNNDGDPENNVLFVENPPVENAVEEGKYTNAVNLYMLGYDRRKRLGNLNTLVKKNIKTYLAPYRMLTDQVNLYDAFIVNLQIDFDITVYKNYNLNDTLARALDTVKKYFDIDKWQINQPIVLSDLRLRIDEVDGVQTINNLEISNKYQQRDGRDYQPYKYDIPGNTRNGIILPSVDPCIFEVRYPEDDIRGSARQ
ncbi:MAG: hypothetical protein VW683_00340 [Betaproteobacteria bacterium]|jgi:hypothetical protein